MRGGAHPARIDLAEPGGLGLYGWLASAVAADRERWVLWCPVAMALGVLGYFALPAEPPFWATVVPAALALPLALLLRRHPARWVAVGLLAVALGLAAAGWKTERIGTPMLADRVGPVLVAGTVVDLEVDPGGARRVTLEGLAIDRLPPAQTPRRVRITVRTGGEEIVPGARVSMRAMLLPARGPVAPGDFDFRRNAFFQGLGSYGFAMGAPEILYPGERSLRLLGETARQAAVGRITAALGTGREAAVAAALLTGERGGLDDDTYAIMRDSGLAHLLAISGLHVGLVAGLIFWVTRWLFAGVPGWALRYPIKKWAAIAALAAAIGYTWLVGAPVPTQRAAATVALVMAAILVDRMAISLRLVAVAAGLVLVWSPDSLLGPSFQMSFGAVVALVAVYERLWRPLGAMARPAGLSRRVLLYCGGVLLTTLIASLATTPFAVYHFDRLQAYGLAANLAAVPLTAFWIMPFGVASLILMPLGLEALALVPMGWGLTLLLEVAGEVSSWPGAVWLVPAMAGWAPLAVGLGGCWLAIWRTRLGWLGAVAILLGVASPAWTPQPLLLVSDDGRLWMARDSDGTPILSTHRRLAFVRENWLERMAARDFVVRPELGASAGGALRCDPEACVLDTGQGRIALVESRPGFVDACMEAELTFALFPYAPACPTGGSVVIWPEILANGAHAVYAAPGGGLAVVSVGEIQGDRPWRVRPYWEVRSDPQ